MYIVHICTYVPVQVGSSTMSTICMSILYVHRYPCTVYLVPCTRAARVTVASSTTGVYASMLELRRKRRERGEVYSYNKK